MASFYRRKYTFAVKVTHIGLSSADQAANSGLKKRNEANAEMPKTCIPPPDL